MLDSNVNLATDLNLRISALEIREEVQREDDGAIGGILKGHDAVGGCVVLDGGEDVFNGRLRNDRVLRFGKAGEGGLGDVVSIRGSRMEVNHIRDRDLNSSLT